MAALRCKAGRSEAEAQFLDASRIAAVSLLSDLPATRHAVDLATLFWLTDLRSAAQSVWSVTNLLMRFGDYAHGGATNLYVIDTDSYGSMAISRKLSWRDYALAIGWRCGCSASALPP